MSDTLPVSTTQPGEAPRAFRVLGLVAVCVGVAALAAATFVLSYPGIHAIALQAGISPRLARGYPLLLDAMLIVVLAAVLSLRGAGVPSRILAWLTMLAVLGAAAGADALHAAKDKLPVRAAEITAAVLPWVLVFLAFMLLLAMLRHAHLRRLVATEPAAASDILPGFHALPGQAGSADPARSAHDPAAHHPAAHHPAAHHLAAHDPAAYDPTAADTQSSVITAAEASAPVSHDTVLQPKLAVPRQQRPDLAANAEATVSAVQTGAARPGQDDQAVDSDLAVDAQLAPGDPSSDETAMGLVQPDPVQTEPVQPEPVQPEPVQPEPEPSEPGPEQPENRIGNDGPDEVVVSGPDTAEATPFGTISPAPADSAESPDPDMPVFHRISSSPIPPGGA